MKRIKIKRKELLITTAHELINLLVNEKDYMSAEKAVLYKKLHKKLFSAIDRL